MKLRISEHRIITWTRVLTVGSMVQLNHPAYSPDLGPSDYSVFRNPKFHLRGTRLTDAESLKVAVEAWFDRQNGKIVFKHVNNVEEK